MHRFFSPSKNILSSNKILISDKKQMHHLKDVLRLKVNDAAVVFDEQGNEYKCVIEELQKDKAIFKVKEKNLTPQSTGRLKITLACAIPKHSKMDDIVDKLTQLGVERIIPLETERVVIKLGEDKEKLRKQRWERIALSAVRQCQRSNLTIIEPIRNIKEVLLNSDGYDLKLIATLLEKQKSLKEIVSQSHPKNILVLVGPEGDFTPAEVELAKAAGCKAISLGDLVLRVETAAVAIVSILNYALK